MTACFGDSTRNQSRLCTDCTICILYFTSIIVDLKRKTVFEKNIVPATMIEGESSIHTIEKFHPAVGFCLSGKNYIPLNRLKHGLF